MINCELISHKKFCAKVRIPVLSCKHGYDYNGTKWIDIDYMIRYVIPKDVGKKPLEPCHDKGFLQKYFDEKFGGENSYKYRYHIVDAKLEDGRIYSISIPYQIMVFRPIDELRNNSIDNLLK